MAGAWRLRVRADVMNVFNYGTTTTGTTRGRGAPGDPQREPGPSRRQPSSGPTRTFKLSVGVHVLGDGSGSTRIAGGCCWRQRCHARRAACSPPSAWPPMRARSRCAPHGARRAARRRARAAHLRLLLGRPTRQRPGARPLALAVVLQHRGRGLRASPPMPIGAERGWITRAGGARARAHDACASSATRRRGPSASGMTGTTGFFYHFLDMRDRRALRAHRALHHRHGAAAWAACSSAARTSTATTRAKPRSARSSSRSTRASTGAGRSRAPPAIGHGWSPEEGLHPVRLAGLQRGDAGVPAGAGRRPRTPVERRGVERPGPATTSDCWGKALRLRVPRASRRSSGTSTRTCWFDLRGVQRRVHARARHRLLRELAPRDVCAARLRDRQSDGLGRIRREGLGPHRVRRARARTAPLPATHAPLPRLLRAARHLERNGTTAPSRRTAAGGSLPFAPEIVIPALAGRCTSATASTSAGATASSTRSTAASTSRACTLHFGRLAPGFGWVDIDYLGIDQGPILLMIENHRSGRCLADDARAIAASVRGPRSARDSPAAGSTRRERGSQGRMSGWRSLRCSPAVAGSRAAAPRGASTRARCVSGPWGARAKWSRNCCRDFEREQSRHPRRRPAAAVDRRAREAAHRVRRRLRCPTSASSATPGFPSSRRSVRSSPSMRARRPRRTSRGRLLPPASGTPTSSTAMLLRRAVVRGHAAALLPPRHPRRRPASTSRRARGTNGRACMAAVKARGGRSATPCSCR